DLLERQLGWLRAPEDLVDEEGRPAPHLDPVHRVRQETSVRSVSAVTDRGHAPPSGEFGNGPRMSPPQHGVIGNDERIRAPLGQRRDGSVEVLLALEWERIELQGP